MASVPPWWPAVAAAPLVLPTAVAPLPELLRYAQRLGLERLLTDRGRRKRGVPLLTLALVWLVLAWWGSGRPERVALLALLARRTRLVLGRRLAGVVADCGFTSRASVTALVATGVPFILGFARSRPVKARLAALSPQQHRWLRGGGAERLGSCPWDERLRLFALGARSSTDRWTGRTVYLAT